MFSTLFFFFRCLNFKWNCELWQANSSSIADVFSEEPLQDFIYCASGEILPLMLCMGLFSTPVRSRLNSLPKNTPEDLWNLRLNSLLLLLIDSKMRLSHDFYINISPIKQHWGTILGTGRQWVLFNSLEKCLVWLRPSSSLPNGAWNYHSWRNYHGAQIFLHVPAQCRKLREFKVWTKTYRMSPTNLISSVLILDINKGGT